MNGYYVYGICDGEELERESAFFGRKEKVQFIPVEYTESVAANASSKGGVEILLNIYAFERAVILCRM